ncbi:3-hydroxyisobutyryl-coa hydrolase-like protein 2 [Quercus suber]|uniref:3-hydroxyisobutyryl-CoA hydrolase n=1 Tax=Quercus suber TaxID=58331 RepID=A0AAW0LPV9_QUESU
MQSLKALVGLRSRSSCSFQRSRFLSHHYQRPFSAQPNYNPQNDDLEDQVLVQGRAKSRASILNRPSALNALTTSMVARLKRLYESWEENSNIGIVLMKGSGRAFCSGADVVTLYQLINDEEKNTDSGHMPHCLTRMSVALTMVFANPETQMGFHPDAGASYYLSRLPGYLGEYLALTGDKLNGVEMIACGLATHYSLNARLAWVEERVGKLITDEPSVIETALAQYGDLVYPDRGSVLHKIDTVDRCFCHDTVEEIIDALEKEAAESYDEWCKTALKKLREASPLSLKITLQSVDFKLLINVLLVNTGFPLMGFLNGFQMTFVRIDTVDRCFCHDTVEEIIDALEKEAAESYDEWCKTALKKLREASPLSLKITLQSIREGRFQTLDQCLAREYRISLNGVSKRVSNDFCEGVRARLVDKDFAPKWDPPSLADVSKDMVDCCFSRLDEFEPELQLPTALREPHM